MLRLPLLLKLRRHQLLEMGILEAIMLGQKIKGIFLIGVFNMTEHCSSRRVFFLCAKRMQSSPAYCDSVLPLFYFLDYTLALSPLMYVYTHIAHAPAHLFCFLIYLDHFFYRDWRLGIFFFKSLCMASGFGSWIVFWCLVLIKYGP